MPFPIPPAILPFPGGALPPGAHANESRKKSPRTAIPSTHGNPPFAFIVLHRRGGIPRLRVPVAVASRRRPLPGHPCPDSTSPSPTNSPRLPPRPPRSPRFTSPKSSQQSNSSTSSPLATWRFNHLKNPSTPAPRLPCDLRASAVNSSLLHSNFKIHHSKSSPPHRHPCGASATP